jgi:hypothetical protein
MEHHLPASGPQLRLAAQVIALAEAIGRLLTLLAFLKLVRALRSGGLSFIRLGKFRGSLAFGCVFRIQAFVGLLCFLGHGVVAFAVGHQADGHYLRNRPLNLWLASGGIPFGEVTGWP